MKPRKYRLRIRLHRKIYDLLEMEALWQDSKIGTLANRIFAGGAGQAPAGRTGPLRVRG
mgnify:CR=1 FL=1